LSNAFKFVPDGGRVRCRLRAEGGEAVAEVEDSGPGVPPELREAGFERFRQADAGANRPHGGIGLGLAISPEVVGLHKGKIRGGGARGGGALCTVRLPLSAAAGVTPAAGAAADPAAGERARQALEELRARPEGPPPAAPPDRPLVLVVEDNPEMRQFV